MKRRTTRAKPAKKQTVKRTRRTKRKVSRMTPEAQTAAIKRFKAPTPDQIDTAKKPDPHWY